METLYPSSYFPNLNFLMQKRERKTEWTKEENKNFERALAIYDKQTPDRWLKVASMLHGKSILDVERHYMELIADVSDIEAGLVPIPGYLSPTFTSEMIHGNSYNDCKTRPQSRGYSDHERKKGVPWTEDEHRRFLMGLEKHGKGDWRNISRNFVLSKTPTQVASHAQKYFKRRDSLGKDKKRPSIHDITTVHPPHTAPPIKDGESPTNIYLVTPVLGEEREHVKNVVGVEPIQQWRNNHFRIKLW